MTNAPPEYASSRSMQVGLTALVAILAVVAVVLFLQLPGAPEPTGQVAGSGTPAASSSATVAASSTAESASPGEPTPEPTVTPQPTATPSPVADPALLAPDDWLLAAVRLNVRRDPGTSSEIELTLEPGDILLVLPESTDLDGYQWHRVATLSGDIGWVASGPADDPFTTIISREEVLHTCGRLGPDATIEGRRFGPALDALEASIVSLGIATEGSGCVTLQRVGEGIVSYFDTTAHACGAPAWDADELWLSPTISGDVVPELQVKERVRVEEILFTTLAVLDADGHSNRHAVMHLSADAAPPFGCVVARVAERGDGDDEVYIAFNAHGCFIMEGVTADTVELRATPEADIVRFRRMPNGHVHEIPLGVPQEMNVTALYSRSDGQFLSILGFGSCS